MCEFCGKTRPPDSIVTLFSYIGLQDSVNEMMLDFEKKEYFAKHCYKCDGFCPSGVGDDGLCRDCTSWLPKEECLFTVSITHADCPQNNNKQVLDFEMLMEQYPKIAALIPERVEHFTFMSTVNLTETYVEVS